MALDLQDGDLVEWFVRGKVGRIGDDYIELIDWNGERVFAFDQGGEDDDHVRMIKRAPRVLKVGDVIPAGQVSELPVCSVIQSIAEPKFILTRGADSFDSEIAGDWYSPFADRFHAGTEIAAEADAEYKILHLPEQ